MSRPFYILVKLVAIFVSSAYAQDPCSPELPKEAFEGICSAVDGCKVLVVAASVSCQGRHAEISRELRRGLGLWALRVNTASGLRGRHGERIQVQLHLEDDRSDANEVRRIYANFTSRSLAHVLVGPYSSELSLAAAEATEGGELMLLLPAAASSRIFEQGWSHILGLSPSAHGYMVDALQHAHARGARSVVLAQGAGDFASAVCEGAAAAAEALSMSVQGNLSISHREAALQLQTLRYSKPDVVIACGHLQEVSLWTVFALAMDMNPKAMFLTHATHPNFIQMLKPENANYISGPVAWAPELSDVCQGCRIFANGSDFAEAYELRFSQIAQYQSAQAAAAGILFLEAVIRAGSYDPSQLREALLRDPVRTFYNLISFQSNGMMGSTNPVRTVQLLPLSPDAPPFLRANSTRHRLLRPGTELVYEMPTWQQKQRAVFPCKPGQYLDEGRCLACSPGRYRHFESMICESCEVSTFAAEPGQSRCQPCPQGANCSSPGTALPVAAAGYYLSSGKDGDIYLSCSPMSLCLGGNLCGGSNQGNMCQQCKAGTSKQRGFWLSGGTGACGKCPPWEQNLVLLALFCLLYCGYTYMIFKATIASAMSIRRLGSIILKIVVNYFVFAQLALQSAPFWNEFLEGGRSLFDPGASSGSNSKELPVYLSFDCLLQQSGMQLFTTQVHAALLLIPAVLLCNALVCILRNLLFLRRLRRQAPQESSFDDGSWSWHEDGQEDSQEESKQWKEFRLTIIQSSVVWIFVLYPGIVKVLIEGIVCRELDVLRLAGNLDIVCFEEDHFYIFVLCISGLVAFGLGIPMLFFLVLYLRRDRLMQPSIRRKYGFLYNGFEHRCYYFECIYMFRKLLILFAASMPQETIRGTLMLCLGLYFFTQHLHLNPFDKREFQVLDQLEVLNLWCFLVTVLLQLLLRAAESAKTDDPSGVLHGPILKSTVLAVVASSHLAFWLHALRALVSDLLIRPLRLRQAAGMQLKRWQLAFLALHRSWGLGNVLFFRDETASLDVEALSEKEKQFLNVALQNTLECYMASHASARPGLVTAALREAVHICRRTRRLQVDWLQRHEDISVPYLASLWGSARAAGRNFLRKARLDSPKTQKGHLEEGSCDQPKTMRDKTLSLLKMPAMEVASMTDSLQGTGEMDGIFVEELHDALMILWPEIRRGRPQLHQLPVGKEPSAALRSSQGQDLLIEIQAALPPSREVSLTSEKQIANRKVEGKETQGSEHTAESYSHGTGVHERNFYLACLVLMERRRLQKVRLELERTLGQLARLSARMKSAPGPVLFQEFLQKLPWTGPDGLARDVGIHVQTSAGDSSPNGRTANGSENAEDFVRLDGTEDAGEDLMQIAAQHLEMQMPRHLHPRLHVHGEMRESQSQPQCSPRLRAQQHPWRGAQTQLQPQQAMKPKPKQRSRRSPGSATEGTLQLPQASQVPSSVGVCGNSPASPLGPSLQPAHELQPVNTRIPRACQSMSQHG